MFALLRKEINVFLSSLVGYAAVVVFLAVIGIFMWVLPGGNNVLESGYATLDTLFAMAPWVFLFLIPAITMRLFAEEKRTGTIELLFTRPLTDWQIILAKYLAAVALVLFSLVPTLTYVLTLYYLSEPVGNIDLGGIWGSFLGLLFLGGGFAAIGTFASSLAENQIVAFIIALLFTFTFYTGLDAVSQMDIARSTGADSVLQSAGMNSHYASMSRGVIDTRDVLYFLSLSAIFLLMTKIVLEKRKW